MKEGNPRRAPRMPQYGVHAPLPTPLVSNTKPPQNKGFKCNALGSFSSAFSKRLMGTWHVPGTGVAPQGTPFPAPGPLLLRERGGDCSAGIRLRRAAGQHQGETPRPARGPGRATVQLSSWARQRLLPRFTPAQVHEATRQILSYKHHCLKLYLNVAYLNSNSL